MDIKLVSDLAEHWSPGGKEQHILKSEQISTQHLTYLCVRSVGFYDFISVSDCTFTFVVDSVRLRCVLNSAPVHCLCESTDVLSVWLQRISTTCIFFSDFFWEVWEKQATIKVKLLREKLKSALTLCCIQKVGTLQLNQIPTDLIPWSPLACSYVITNTQIQPRHTIYSELRCSSPRLSVISNIFHRTNCHSRFSATVWLFRLTSVFLLKS